MIYHLFILLFLTLFIFGNASPNISNILKDFPLSERTEIEEAMGNVQSKGHTIVTCTTSKGPIAIEVIPEWSPLGAKRFLDLVKDNFYTDIALYRSVDKFLTQFGITDNIDLKHWHHERINDDPNLNIGIKKHYISFAGSGPNSRTTQIFIAYNDLPFLGKSPWETPFAKIIGGENTVASFERGYGDIAPYGKGPSQQKLHIHGNQYIRNEFPKIDFIHSCQIAV